MLKKVGLSLLPTGLIDCLNQLFVSRHLLSYFILLAPLKLTSKFYVIIVQFLSLPK